MYGISKKFPYRDVDSVFKRLQRTGFLSEVIETSDVEGETLSLDINSVGFEAESEFSRFNEIVLKTFYESQTPLYSPSMPQYFGILMSSGLTHGPHS